MTVKKAPASPATQSVPVASARPEVLNVNRLVASLVSDLPTLDGFKPLVKNVAALISYHRLGVNISEALANLTDAEIIIATIPPGIKAMSNAANIEAQNMAKEFAELTGYEMDPESLDSAPALDTEMKEQGSEKKEGVELRARVGNIRVSLFGEERPRGKVENWIAAAKDTASKVIYEQPNENVSNELPGWKTPPKLDEKDPNVAKLLKQLKLFEATKATLGDPSATLEQLQNVGFSPTRVREILDAAEDLANEQIVQSETIERLVPAQRNIYVARAAKIASVRTIAEEAQDYLDSATAGKK